MCGLLMGGVYTVGPVWAVGGGELHSSVWIHRNKEECEGLFG